MPETRTLAERLPDGPVDNDTVMEIFLDWVLESGREPYPAQEEAILEIFDGQHVVLNTPTGSGKSLVALAMHFMAFARARRSIYTSPIKALVSEKFFALCQTFGAEHVGMMTGDASINRNAPILCCTAEILSSMALTEGDAAGVHYAILDEFHYYGDRDRGMAWQIPLLTLTQTTFLLMSATLGDTERMRTRLAERTGRGVALVKSDDRPVPLDYIYSEEPLLHTIEELVKLGRAPVYVVNFTQRDCAELVQSLTSINFCTKDEKKAIAAELKGVRFTTPYGKRVQKYVRHGLGIHHAGLLPKYRLLVEGLAQKGLLKVIVGTDTLGVGINVPIRTVLFSKLCKYDGHKTRILAVRDFKQIGGRAGRKGFDDAGFVVCQAPAHVIENLKMTAKAGGDKKKSKRMVRKKPPNRGYVHWDEETFEQLIKNPSERLVSRFKVSHGLIISLLQREGPGGGYRGLIDLIGLSHESDARKRRLRRESKTLFRQLLQAKLIELVPRRPRGQTAQVASDLQQDFSMYHTLSLFLLYAAGRIPPEDEDHGIRVLTLLEAILEDPRAVLLKQQDKERSEQYAQMKADRVEYDERQEILEQITWPMPDAEAIFADFDSFAEQHPWVHAGMIRPKSIARDMYERYATFSEYVRFYGLERVEGVLLRHLGQTYKTLMQTVPEMLKSEAVYDIIGYLRATIARADSSLMDAWETMVHGGPTKDREVEDAMPKPLDLSRHPKLFQARIRGEVHAFVRALSQGRFEEAGNGLREDPEDVWDAERIERTLAPFTEEYGAVVFGHDARNARYTQVEKTEPGRFTVRQVLCDGEGDNMWFAEGEIDLRNDSNPDGSLWALKRISN